MGRQGHAGHHDHAPESWVDPDYHWQPPADVPCERSGSPESRKTSSLPTGWFRDLSLKIEYQVMDDGICYASIWAHEAGTCSPASSLPEGSGDRLLELREAFADAGQVAAGEPAGQGLYLAG